MKTATLLRIAAILALLQFCAHTMLFVTYAPKHGAEEINVVQAMQSHYFSFSGSLRSYWDFYFGYGLFSAFNCLIEAVLFWQLATIAGNVPRAVRPVTTLFLLANLGYVALVWKYFFPLPSYFDLAIALVLGLAIFAESRSSSAHAESDAQGVMEQGRGVVTLKTRPRKSRTADEAVWLR